MKCSVCGSDNLEGSAYCEDCGAKLPARAAAGVPTPAMSSGMPPPMMPPMMPPITPQYGGPPAPPPMPPMGMTPPVGMGRPGPMITCACGAANAAGEQYCHDCGANLQAPITAHSLNPVMPAPAPVYTPPPMAPPRATSTAKLHATAYGRDFSLDRDVTQMGRRSPADGIEPEVDLTPMDPDSYASRRHARILRQNEQFFLEDLGSSNGTFLNGTRLEKGVEHPLQNGDKVRFGKTEFVFSM